MPATDVIFRIGTLGISKAQAELGVLVTALVRIGQVVAANVKEADKFSDAWSKLSASQKQNVQAMDTATKGFISTMDNITASGKIAAAGIEPTAKQMQSLSLLAANVAKNLGEGPEGAKTRLDALTESLIKGNARGLKPYGIELTTAGTLAEKQAEALAKITERAEGLTIEMDGLDDKWAALNNAIDKNNGLMYDWLGGVGPVKAVFDGMIDGLGEWNKLMVDTNGGIADFQYSLDGLSFTFQTLGNRIGIAAAELLGLDSVMAALEKKQSELNTESVVKIGEYAKENQSPTTTAPQIPKSKYKGGGGGGKPESMVISEEEAWAAQMNDLGSGLSSAEESIRRTEALLGAFTGKAAIVDDILLGMQGISYEAGVQTELLARQIEIEAEYSDPLEQRIALKEQENDQSEKRLELLQAMAEIDPTMLSTDEKKEMWDADIEHQEMMREYEAEHAAYIEDIAEKEGKFWLKSKQHKREDATAWSLMRAGMEGVKRTSADLFAALWTGSLSSATAVKHMIAEIMQGMSIEYAVKAIAEGAEAIISLARQDYSAAAEHGAAAGYAAAASAACAVAALTLGGSNLTGGSTGESSAMSGGGGSASMGGSSYGGGYSGKENDGPTEIVINVDGSMANLFAQLQVHATKKKKAGAYSGGF